MTEIPPRVIKRYPNRKLYDTTESRYITVKEIGALIKENIMVQILDNTTGEDLTHDFLLQVIRNQEKKWKLFPLKALVDLIRSQASSSTEFVASVRREVDQKVQDFPGLNELRETVESYQNRFEEWQKSVENQIHSVIELPASLISREVDNLKERISQLEKLVSELKSKLDNK